MAVFMLAVVMDAAATDEVGDLTAVEVMPVTGEDGQVGDSTGVELVAAARLMAQTGAAQTGVAQTGAEVWDVPVERVVLQPDTRAPFVLAADAPRQHAPAAPVLDMQRRRAHPVLVLDVPRWHARPAGLGTRVEGRPMRWPVTPAAAVVDIARWRARVAAGILVVAARPMRWPVTPAVAAVDTLPVVEDMPVVAVDINDKVRAGHEGAARVSSR